MTVTGVAHAETPPSCFGERATIVGTDGDDTIHGTPHKDVIVTGDGNDTVYGEGGNDRICAQSSQPNPVIKRLYGGTGDDRIKGSPRTNFIHGGRGNDHVYGGNVEGNTLYDGPGDDYVAGGDGIDHFIAGSGNDVLLGGDTTISPIPLDSVSYENSPRPVVIDLEADTATGYGHDIVKHIWGARGSRFDDILRGTPRDDRLYGGCGDDHLYGRAGEDDLGGGDGDCSSDVDVVRGGPTHDRLHGSDPRNSRKDRIYGGGGKDTFYNDGGREHFYGGAGSDLFKLTNDVPSDAALHIDLAAGTYSVGGRSGGVVRNVENVIGGDADDVIAGNAEDNGLLGLGGSDNLRGRAGDDVLHGDWYAQNSSAWSDAAYGGPGTDTCTAEVEHSCER